MKELKLVGPKNLEMPSPTSEDIESKEFNAVWEVIKSWDVNVPEFYQGYCGANGSHVKLILNALKGLENDPRS